MVTFNEGGGGGATLKLASRFKDIVVLEPNPWLT